MLCGSPREAMASGGRWMFSLTTSPMLLLTLALRWQAPWRCRLCGASLFSMSHHQVTLHDVVPLRSTQKSFRCEADTYPSCRPPMVAGVVQVADTEQERGAGRAMSRYDAASRDEAWPTDRGISVPLLFSSMSAAARSAVCSLLLPLSLVCSSRSI